MHVGSGEQRLMQATLYSAIMNVYYDYPQMPMMMQHPYPYSVQPQPGYCMSQYYAMKRNMEELSIQISPEKKPRFDQAFHMPAYQHMPLPQQQQQQQQPFAHPGQFSAAFQPLYPSPLSPYLHSPTFNMPSPDLSPSTSESSAGSLGSPNFSQSPFSPFGFSNMQHALPSPQQQHQNWGYGPPSPGQMSVAQMNSGPATPPTPDTPILRTVYVGNLPSDASIDELLNQVRFGPIENIKIIGEKSCVFISFLDAHTAAAFESDANIRRLTLHGLELKVGFGKPSTVSPSVLEAVHKQSASRNVFVGGLGLDMTEKSLRDEFSEWGPIDQVKIVRDRGIGFIHFLSIATAVRVVEELQDDPEWDDRKVNFGKDRCECISVSAALLLMIAVRIYRRLCTEESTSSTTAQPQCCSYGSYLLW